MVLELAQTLCLARNQTEKLFRYSSIIKDKAFLTLYQSVVAAEEAVATIASKNAPVDPGDFGG